MNYELLWEDDDPDTIAWVQEEVDALWNDSRAVDLSCCPFIQQDVQRIIRRKVIEPEEWKASDDPTSAAATAAVETPVYRREQGLWPHQKYFARLALERHRLGGARLILADQVGLGKTIQLAMAGMLMALDDPNGGPILVLAPKPLLRQWQDEFMELLLLPSARWNGRAWVDENDLEYPWDGARALANVPGGSAWFPGTGSAWTGEALRQLLGSRYTCVIVDEAHRARRRKVPRVEAAPKRSTIRASRTMSWPSFGRSGRERRACCSPLPRRSSFTRWSPGISCTPFPRGMKESSGGGLGRALGFVPAVASESRLAKQGCQAMTSGMARNTSRDPLPSRHEDSRMRRIRDHLDAGDIRWQFSPESIDRLSPAIRRVQLRNGLLPDYGTRFNPLLRCIVRRTRGYLENMVNPATGSYFLPKVSVRLFGEEDESALNLGGYLQEAYQEAEHFSELLQQRVRGAGFFKTLLLRRLGSSMEAGRRTIRRLLGADSDAPDDEDEDDAEEDEPAQVADHQGASEFKNFTDAELSSLNRCLELLRQGGANDPKLEALISYLLGTNDHASARWLDLGCILFSQYYDTVRWVGDELAKRPEFEELDIGLYAGSNRSGFWRGGRFQRCDRNDLKARVRAGELRLLLGTDAASERA